MPFVRAHGNQIAIVHGERDKTSGKVQQRSLFTFYSKAEVAAAVGDRKAEDATYFERLLETANPQLSFDWIELKKEIRKHSESLPEIYPLRKIRSEDNFESALLEFTRQIAIIDPLRFAAGRETMSKYREDLAVLQDLIAMRLADLDVYDEKMQSPFKLDDNFCWRYEIQSHSMPLDLEEYASEVYRNRDYGEAKSLYRLLTRVFPDFAEGYNKLGLVALTENEPKEAVKFFRNAAKYGRTLFPRRMHKAHYWLDYSTRPYMRGLMNLALALNASGEFEESLQVCDQLEKECGESGKETAFAHRSAAYLNLQRWQEAADSALEISQSAPSEGFCAAYALFELGRLNDAMTWYLYAALSNPHTAWMLNDQKKPKPVTHREIEDHNGGIELYRLLPRFFESRSKESTKFFKKLIANEVVKSLLLEAVECQRKHFDGKGNSSKNLARWNELMTFGFAEKLSKSITGA